MLYDLWEKKTVMLRPVASPGHPEHPIVIPPPVDGGRPPIDPGAHPEHPIVIPPDAIAPGVPTHPIYIPVYPAHPIVIPPGSIGPGVPTHPIVLPPPHPAHPIVIPPDAIAPGVPTHPIILPGVPTHPIYYPPHIWGPPDMPPGFWGGGMGPGVKPQPPILTGPGWGWVPGGPGSPGYKPPVDPGLHPEHPIFYPPHIWGPTDPRPNPPIMLPGMPGWGTGNPPSGTPLPPDYSFTLPPAPPTGPPDLASPGYYCYLMTTTGYKTGWVQTLINTSPDHTPVPPEKGLPGTWTLAMVQGGGLAYVWTASADTSSPPSPPPPAQTMTSTRKNV